MCGRKIVVDRYGFHICIARRKIQRTAREEISECRMACGMIGSLRECGPKLFLERSSLRERSERRRRDRMLAQLRNARNEVVD